MSHAETLKSMLQSIINDRHEEASVTIHEYFVAKTKEVAGLSEGSAKHGVDKGDFNALPKAIWGVFEKAKSGLKADETLSYWKPAKLTTTVELLVQSSSKNLLPKASAFTAGMLEAGGFEKVTIDDNSGDKYGKATYIFKIDPYAQK